MLKVEHGSARSQQCVEALANLVDLRLRCLSWVVKRFTLFVRSDSDCAVTSIMFCKASGVSVALIARERESALDIAEHVYGPSVVADVIGCMNLEVGVLSRLEETGTAHAAPACLQAAQRAVSPVRDTASFRTLFFLKR